MIRDVAIERKEEVVARSRDWQREEFSAFIPGT
jgi:hypothetical protein